MKKLFISIMLLLLVSLSFCVYAADETGGYKAEFVELEEVYTENTISLFSEPTVPFEEFLYDALYNRKLDAEAEDKYGARYKALDVSAYNIPIDKAIDIFENIALKNPELMMDTSRYGGWPNTGNAILLIPFYLFEDLDESRAEYAKMEKWIDDFVSSVDKTLSDEEKLLKAYYFVADNVKYSYGEMFENQDPLIFTAFNAYKNKHCVCQGYTSLMCAILEKLGIECGVVPTVEALQYEAPHIWNYVVLDGKNYHLDITWDDLDYSDAKVGYDDFLVSDETRYANMGLRAEYEEYVSQNIPLWKFFDGDKVCDSTKYESGYIWNWYNIKNITQCARGYKGQCWLIIDEEGTVDEPWFVFETVKIPNDEIIMSEITSNNHLFYDVYILGRVYSSLYIAEYDENNRMIGVTNLLNKKFYNNAYIDYIDVTKPDAHKINIMWLNSRTFAPLGRNVIME